MYKVTLNNGGGELDSKEAASEEEAARVAAEMIIAAGRLCDGDTIHVQEVDGDQ